MKDSQKYVHIMVKAMLIFHSHTIIPPSAKQTSRKVDEWRDTYMVGGTSKSPIKHMSYTINEIYAKFFSASLFNYLMRESNSLSNNQINESGHIWEGQLLNK